MDLSLPILDKEGEQVEARVNKLNDKGENEISVKKFFFKDGLIQALLKEEEYNLKEEEEVNERFDLFMKIKDEEQIEFTEEEKVLLKKLLIEKFDVLVCGQIFKQF